MADANTVPYAELVMGDNTLDEFARKFQKWYGSQFRYWGNNVFAWNGQRWIRDENEGCINAYLKHFVNVDVRGQFDALQKFYQENPIEDPDEAKKQESYFSIFRKILIVLSSAEGQDKIRKSFLRIPEQRFAPLPNPVPLIPLDSDPYLLNCANVTLRFEREGVKPYTHDQELLCSHITSVAWDPNATCPLWESALERWMRNVPGAVRLLQQWAGYSLLGLNTVSKFMFFWGAGANGKSTYMDTLVDIMGTYAFTGDYENTFGAGSFNRGEYYRVLMVGTRLARFNEVSSKSFNVNEIKRLTSSRELQTARPPAHEPIQFYNLNKFIFYGNNKPKISDQSDGFWRRIVFVPWLENLEAEADVNFPEKLKEEYSGILNWAIRGMYDFFENGLVIPDSILRATSNYRQAEDTFGEFFEDCYDRIDLPDGIGDTVPRSIAETYGVKKQDLWNRYYEYATKQSEAKVNKSVKDLVEYCLKVAKLQVIQESNSHKWYVLGLKERELVQEIPETPRVDFSDVLRGGGF